MITLDRVYKHFVTNKNGDFVVANNNINLKINKGEVVGIIGKNGAGKTTLLRIIAGLLTPDSGTIKINNMDFINNNIELKSKNAYLSNNTELYEDLSANEILDFVRDIYELDNETFESRKQKLYKHFDVNEYCDTPYSKLSTGQKQKISIIRTMIVDPEIYILDEITTGLDIESVKNVNDFILKEKELKKTILYSSHNMEEVEKMCDRIIIVDKGKIIYDGTIKQAQKETKTKNLRDSLFKKIEEAQNEKK